ncbi:MAG: DUF4097 family beta strand repeat-containing protein [Gammaproteobacteria bacterium]|nr:DUF4097 family beta strand repeat-containing protein [Gammaproteobacteria bacterium]MDH4314473.1 DUF4097 family beta strand repeat-containing protein [Gammaproteobacteria bacterium]MDH5213214.1 DUF4097 family beta strand repeat-containing protein [Gammaproteobacteria bacterium]MDH5500850.1 DUF4097 family beta strand repeat-containing protein [Gammaproteobacteria bacterium]
MNRLIVLTAMTLLGVSASANEVNKSMEAAADGAVDVSNVAGSVEIRGWSRREVSVSADLGSDVEELVFERDGDQVSIRVEAPRRSARHITSDLVIHVPEKSSVQVGTVSADITVRDVSGSQTLNTVSGDIDIEAFTGDLEIETVSGDVEVQGNGKKINARINSVSGDVVAEQLAGEISAGSVSGDIELLNGSFDRVRLNTTNGDMVFRASLSDGGRFSAETINGELDVRFASKVSARFEVETFNGDIRNCFGPKPVRTSKYAPGRELNFSEGKGEGWVTIKTLNGDVALCRD